MMRFDEFGMYDDADTMSLLGLPTTQAAPIAAPAPTPSGISITDPAKWNWWDQERGGQVGIAGSLFDQMASMGYQPGNVSHLMDPGQIAAVAGLSDAEVAAQRAAFNARTGAQARNSNSEGDFADYLRNYAQNIQAQRWLEQTGNQISTQVDDRFQNQQLINAAGQTLASDSFDYGSFVDSENKAVTNTALTMAALMGGAAYMGGAGLGAAGGGGGAGAGAAGAGGSVVMTPMGPAVIPAAAGGGAVGSVGSALPGLLGTGAAGGLGASMGGVPIDPTIAPSFGDAVGKTIGAAMTEGPAAVGIQNANALQSALLNSGLGEIGGSMLTGAGQLMNTVGGSSLGQAASNALAPGKGGGSSSLIPAIVGGIAGAAEGGKPTTATTQQQIDPRMAQYLYGTGYGDKNSFLGAAQDWWKNNQSGMNANMQQGLDTLRNLYTSPSYSQGYTQMRDVGQGLLGRPIAGNPFTQGGGLLGTPMQQPMQPPGPEVGVPRFNMPRSI
jgi:hypothetical protein